MTLKEILDDARTEFKKQYFEDSAGSIHGTFYGGTGQYRIFRCFGYIDLGCLSIKRIDILSDINIYITNLWDGHFTTASTRKVHLKSSVK